MITEGIDKYFFKKIFDIYLILKCSLLEVTFGGIFPHLLIESFYFTDEASVV